MKNIMILGTGNAQTDAIKYCKEAGYKTYGCSNATGYKSIELLDEFVLLDVRDYVGISEYAAKNGIDAIYSVGSDIAMPAAMRASEILNLPHYLSYETALTCQNKNRIRAFLGNDFEGNLPYMIATCIDEAMEFDGFPCMMKPVDSQAQRGCFRVGNSDEMRDKFGISLEYSASKHVILERFVDGPEISVNAFVDNGVIVFSLISDRVVFDEFPGGIIKEHHLPSTFTTPKGQENIQSLVRRVIHKLGIMNGPVYFQIKMEGDTPYLIEVTPRLDGCHMWKLIKYYCGVDLLDATFRHLLKPQEPLSYKIVPEHETMKLKFMCERPGVAFDRNKYPFAQSPDNYYQHWYYETGDIVMKQNGWMEKGGYIICR